MAADLHDRMICTCGCGQWEKDAHDPLNSDLWEVDHQTCYVRRAIDTYVKVAEPASDAVISVRLGDGEHSGATEHEQLLARFPHLAEANSAAARQADAQRNAPGDDGHQEGDHQK